MRKPINTPQLWLILLLSNLSASADIINLSDFDQKSKEKKLRVIVELNVDDELKIEASNSQGV